MLYKGKSIADVLAMPVGEALEFLSTVPPIRHKLETLRDVGLDYIHLGQSATTLSGGEAQRIKLAKELSRRATGRTLYILDEPTTGLHFDDIRRLLYVLSKLADAGNTVVIIEHNLDVIKTADYVIDLGPGRRRRRRPRRRGRNAGGRGADARLVHRRVPAAPPARPRRLTALRHARREGWSRQAHRAPAPATDCASRRLSSVCARYGHAGGATASACSKSLSAPLGSPRGRRSMPRLL